MTNPNHLPVGADTWIHKNPYRKGIKEHAEWELNRDKRFRKHRKQRADNGYSWEDWINFDSYIVPVIANAILDFAEHGVGFFPMDNEEPDPLDYAYPQSTQENHTATLGAIYYALSEYSKVTDAAIGPEWEMRYAEAQEALHIFVDHLAHWWD